jgi:GTP-binding protein
MNASARRRVKPGNDHERPIGICSKEKDGMAGTSSAKARFALMPGHDEEIMSDTFTRDEIDAGRRLFSGDWQFVAAAGSAISLPPMRGVEIALAGRSNVGKSSLINALTGRKSLARISRTPGRTQELIFFNSGNRLTLVDMPGYGYAATAKAKIAAWTDLIHAYLRGRANLARIYVLIDARHGLKPTDDAMFEVLGQAAVSHQIVLTKCDELKPAELAPRIAEVEAALRKRPAAYPTVLATSAHDGSGIAELRAAVARLLKEQGR